MAWERRVSPVFTTSQHVTEGLSHPPVWFEPADIVVRILKHTSSNHRYLWVYMWIYSTMCTVSLQVCVCVYVCVCSVYVGGEGEGSELSMVGIYAHSNTLYHVSRLLHRHLFLMVWREVTNCMNNIYIVHVQLYLPIPYRIIYRWVGLTVHSSWTYDNLYR